MEAQKSNRFLYRTIWRWHFYAGLFCIPFILTLSVSGAIFLFKPQIEAWIDKPHMQLNTAGVRATAQEQIAIAQRAFPDASFDSYRLPQSESESIVISLNDAGRIRLVYVDPYSQTVVKSVLKNEQLIRLVRSFHGELLLGNPGSIVIELAGTWAIVMILTGLYLWWPKASKNKAQGVVGRLGGVLYPRLKQGSRIFWRDIHAVFGIWIAFFTLFLLISGLPWALVWGSAFKEIRKTLAPPAEQNWQIQTQNIFETKDKTLLLSESIIQKAQALSFAPPVEVSVNKNQWRVSSQTQNRPLRADAWLDPDTAEVMKTKSFADKAGVDRVIGFGIAAHEGHLFGWANQALGLFTTLGLIIMTVSGFIMWRRRKPKDQLGAPEPLEKVNIKTGLIVMIVALAIFLPLLSASIIFLLLLEYVFLRRLPLVRSWLGFRAN